VRHFGSRQFRHLSGKVGDGESFGLRASATTAATTRRMPALLKSTPAWRLFPRSVGKAAHQRLARPRPEKPENPGGVDIMGHTAPSPAAGNTATPSLELPTFQLSGRGNGNRRGSWPDHCLSNVEAESLTRRNAPSIRFPASVPSFVQERDA
jgi:hypothetical protein